MYNGSPSLKVAIALANLDQDFPAGLELQPNALDKIKILRAILSGDYQTALLLSRALSERLGAPDKLSLNAEIHSLVLVGKLEEALRSAVAWCLKDQRLATWTPLEDLHHAISESPINLSHVLEKSVLYDLLSRHRSIGYTPLKAYACEDYLASLGIERPSQIDVNATQSRRQLMYYFLSEVCTAPVLRLSTAYSSEHELEDELVAVLSNLAKLDEDNSEKYEERVRDVVRQRSIRGALKELQRSKVSIDEDALRVWCERNLKEDFDRYIALLKSGVAVLDEAYQSELLKAVSAGEYPESLYEVPVNEASSLFAKLVTRIFFECIYNAEHGLDCYLSLRVRHGTLSGQLRSPLEQELLVTRRDATTGKYQENKYWRDALSNEIPNYEVYAVVARLAAFSREYDELLGELTDKLIQIKRTEKPEGLFELKLPELTVYGLATEVKATTTFQTLLDLCLQIFWTLLNVALKEVRQYIDVNLRGRIRNKFDELERDLNEISSAPIISRLADSIRRSRTETGIRLDAMRDWFVEPTPDSAIPFTVPELIDIGLAAVKSLHPTFEPRLSLEYADVPPISGGLNLFSDIFFILFENIILYSGNATNPTIRIMAYEENARVQFRVENDVNATEDIEVRLKRVDAAHTNIKTGAYLSAVRREGGTGLPKLAKLIRRRDENPQINFDFAKQTKMFFVEFALQVTLIQAPEPKNEIAVG
jgi:hypothetical protein